MKVEFRILATPQAQTLMHRSAGLLEPALNCQPPGLNVNRPAIFNAPRVSAHFRFCFHDEHAFLPEHSNLARSAPDQNRRRIAANDDVAVERDIAVGVLLARANLKLRLLMRDRIHAQTWRREKSEVALAWNQYPDSRKI